MQISVIIVSFNAKYFLEQCMHSVLKAAHSLKHEIIIIDNASSDGTRELIENRFPAVRFIANSENIGFSKANNQALRIATGKYILFLNPDTLIAEDCFSKCLEFFEKNKNTGVLGVKMIDGAGHYLKESKRGFPGPWRSFCKLFGLTRWFPHSRWFSGYYLGQLNKDENHQIECVSGAFFFTLSEILSKCGGFDEQFFMYAEDIDLSYRIRSAGFINYYLSNTTIIHFKGESTLKDNQYIRTFYHAMSRFSRKYAPEKFGSFYNFFIESGIQFRMVLALISRKKVKKADFSLENLLLVGDESSKQELTNKLKTSFSGESSLPGLQIVFCEGVNYSFKQIIEDMQGKYGGKFFSFHSFGSGAIIQSTKEQISGTALLLNS